MGRSDSEFTSLYKVISQLKRETPLNNIFELGDNSHLLSHLENELYKIKKFLDGFDNIYSTQSLENSNPYLLTIMAVQKAQKFIEDLRNKGDASGEKVREFHNHLQNIESNARQFQEHMNNNHHFSGKRKEVPSKHQKKSTENHLLFETDDNFENSNRSQLEDQFPKKQNIFILAIQIILLLPEMLGRLFFDLMKHQNPARSSSIIMGSFFILLILFFIKGVLTSEQIIEFIRKFAH